MPRPPGARPVLALLTDFGNRDPYVGAMKGAALEVCSDLTIVDLTHDVAPHDVAEGARHLAAAAPYFPAGTAFVAVVDPGVGSRRRAIAAEAGDHVYVGPDNGIFSGVFAATPPRAIVELADPRYARSEVSRTFEGRDRFAPAAAWILRGVPLASLGPPVDDLCRLDLDAAAVVDGALAGRLVAADRFGNVLSSIDRQAVEVFAAGRPIAVRLGGRTVRFVGTYAEIADGEVAALFGSAGLLEVASRAAPALGRDGVAIGGPIVVILFSP